MHSSWSRLEQILCRITPAALTAFMVLLAAVPLRLPGLSQLMPAFTLINIYYWGVFYPGALPYVFLFVLGLVQDALTGTPLGLSSFINMMFAFLLIVQRRIFGKTLFRSVWAGFAALSLVILILQWTIVCIYSSSVLPVGGYLQQWLSTCLAYPLLHVLLTRVYRVIHP